MPPLVSVVVPAYRSERTLPAHLASLRAQTFVDFELIVVDSGPDDRSRTIVEEGFPGARYFHAPERLQPQAARNLGARHARGDLLLFTDPDIYPPPPWIQTLLSAHREGHAVVLGPVSCHGNRWLDRGVHLCKFSICLPGGAARAVARGWSGNILVSRDLFVAAGGWCATRVQGDTVFTAGLTAAGHALWFEPRAVVAHDHAGLGFRSFLAERKNRGAEFAHIQASGELGPGAGRAVTPLRWLASLALVPLRAGNDMRRIHSAAARAGRSADFALTAPVVLAGVFAWHAGMIAARTRLAFARRF